MAHGGARKGAGKPKGRLASHTIEAIEQRKIFCEVLRDRLIPIANALADKAEKGDVAAAKEIFDRAWGKVVQSIDHTTNGKDMPLPILANVQSDEHTKED